MDPKSCVNPDLRRNAEIYTMVVIKAHYNHSIQTIGTEEGDYLPKASTYGF